MPQSLDLFSIAVPILIVLLSLTVLAIHKMRETRRKAVVPGTVGLPTDPDMLYP